MIVENWILVVLVFMIECRVVMWEVLLVLLTILVFGCLFVSIVERLIC